MGSPVLLRLFVAEAYCCAATELIYMPYSHPQPLEKSDALRRIHHLLPGALVLAGAAGFINSVVLGFFRTPVSHMTGAVSHLGMDLASGRYSDAVASFSIMAGFVVGALAAGLMVGAWKLIPGRRYGVALVVQGILLGFASALLVKKNQLGLPLASAACGLQNAMSSSYCGLMIRTTHVTGTVTDIGVMLGHWLRHRQIQVWKLWFLVRLALAFGVGGWLGAVAELKYGPAALWVSSVGCSIAGAVFWFVTHQGLVELMQSAEPQPPRTSSFPQK